MSEEIIRSAKTEIFLTQKGKVETEEKKNEAMNRWWVG
jgi:hypothetical protein